MPTSSPLAILLIGAGGREHALAWALARSPLCGALYAAPGNPGIAEHARLLAIDTADEAAVIAACRANAIDLVVVGPEVPLVAGLVDVLAAAGIRAFGPSKAAAMLEGSKGFTKDLCAAANIPTAAYGRFVDIAAAKAHVARNGAPIVVKADGLAAGKGVSVAATIEEANAALDACFATPGAEVVVEAFMEGTEASLFALCAGETAIVFGTAQDHKRAFDGDEGPNTGGMGAFSPAVNLTPALEARAMDEIVRPTLAEMARRGTPFVGILYAGLMLTAGGPKLVEYNCRFGDPETQVLMPRLGEDLVALMLAAIEGRLAGRGPVVMAPDAALAIVVAAKAYPAAGAAGEPIAGLGRAGEIAGLPVFHAGTALSEGQHVANGGRVLFVFASEV